MSPDSGAAVILTAMAIVRVARNLARVCDGKEDADWRPVKITLRV
jgi:hypothetical protein